jgi:vancomycin permeability regulator SanA
MLRKYLRPTLLAFLAIGLLGTIILVWDGLSDELGSADVGLVLGNTVNPDGTPSPRLLARLDRAVDLYQQGLFPKIIVSGARGKEGYDEAIAMRDFLRRRGIPVESIVADSAGATTYESARNVRTFLRERHLHSVVVVSQYFHIPRARLALKQFGRITRVLRARPLFRGTRLLFNSAGTRRLRLLSYSEI